MKLIGGLTTGLLAVLAGCGLAFAASTLLFGDSPEDKEVPPHWEHGMNVTAFLPDAYAEPLARRALLTARAAGTERVALVPTWYMDDAAATAVRRDPEKTPTDESLVAAAGAVRDLGLDVVIKPHVDVLDGTFRGEISPSDPEAWFASYREMLLGYADLATEVGASDLIIGTELTSMSLDAEPWRKLIDEVRSRYDGRLSFAANWVDGADSIEFWDALDYIGIDAYMPLMTPRGMPSVEELIDAWGPYVSRMRSLHKEWDLPIIFTEAGYQDRVGAASRVGQDSGEISEQAQADAYEAAFEALHELRWFDGIWWWDWSAEGPPTEPGTFTPENKLAQGVLMEWLGAPRMP